MDGENNENPYEQMDDLEVPLFLETPIWDLKFFRVLWGLGFLEASLGFERTPEEGSIQSLWTAFGFRALKGFKVNTQPPPKNGQ